MTTMKTTAGVMCSCTLGEWRPAPNIAVGLVRNVQMPWDACHAYPHWRSDSRDCARWRSCIVCVCVYSKSIVDERRLLHATNAPRMQWDRIAVPAQVSAQFLIFVTRSSLLMRMACKLDNPRTVCACFAVCMVVSGQLVLFVHWCWFPAVG